MSINSPRMPGPYPHRAEDCEHAIERDFLRSIVNVTTPFQDLDRVLADIADDAARAGWSEEEFTDAVIRLARKHHLNPRQRGELFKR